MDYTITQLRQIASDALVGHFPLHLNLKTDEDKIRYLAAQLRDTLDELVSALDEGTGE